MKMLTRSAFDRARSYIQTSGRELDHNLLAYYFEGRDKNAVIGALRSYQNSDGGFGQALEPDLRTPASSAIATQQAFNYLRAVDAGYQEELVRQAVDYLLESFDHESGVWPIIPPEVENAPHAPWWSYADSAENFGSFRVNPTAALAGHLHHYKSIVPNDFLAQVTEQLLSFLTGLPDTEMNMHDLHCCLTLADGLTGAKKKVLLEKLTRVAPQSMETDRSKWVEYTLRPLALAPSPESPLASVMESSVIEANLDYEIEEQLEDGSWPLSWSWDFIDEAAWASAEKEWKGYHALQKLVVFRAYGRLDRQ